MLGCEAPWIVIPHRLYLKIFPLTIEFCPAPVAPPENAMPLPPRLGLFWVLLLSITLLIINELILLRPFKVMPYLLLRMVLPLITTLTSPMGRKPMPPEFVEALKIWLPMILAVSGPVAPRLI